MSNNDLFGLLQISNNPDEILSFQSNKIRQIIGLGIFEVLTKK
jgi:hypothetical protein